MYIPLTINNSLAGESWPNVLVAGDTAGIFYVLSMISDMECNIFLADTGIKRPLREFPCHRSNSKDKANTYYDFFDDLIGSGNVRRMDCVIAANNDMLQEWCNLFQVPYLGVKLSCPGMNLLFEGRLPLFRHTGSEGDVVKGYLQDFIRPNTFYDPNIHYVTVDTSGHVETPSGKSFKKEEKIIPKETTCSAWDSLNEVLQKGEWFVVMKNGEPHEYDYNKDDDVKLIELGVPELHVLKIYDEKDVPRFVELTGDLARVFDGLF